MPNLITSSSKKNAMTTLAVIPARYASTRFPGKPLAMLCGKPVIRWVWERVSQTEGITDTVVATDDSRIADAVETFGGKVMMTSATHRSGTDRCGEVVERLMQGGKAYDVVVNVQGDEPFVRPAQLQQLLSAFEHDGVQIATLRTLIKNGEELFSPNNVKVVCGADDEALYFSRQALPYLRGVEQSEWVARHQYYKHVGIYAFRSEVLRHVVTLQPSALEQAESLEQLRWIENGYRIAVKTTDMANIGIDTPEDLDAAVSFMNQHQQI